MTRDIGTCSVCGSRRKIVASVTWELLGQTMKRATLCRPCSLTMFSWEATNKRGEVIHSPSCSNETVEA